MNAQEYIENQPVKVVLTVYAGDDEQLAFYNDYSSFDSMEGDIVKAQMQVVKLLRENYELEKSEQAESKLLEAI
jgi:hypothetical protein